MKATTPRRQRRVRGLIAGAAGAALLLAGGTWALWSASDGLSGATITAGNLDIRVGEVGYWDVSDLAGTDGNTSGGNYRSDQDVKLTEAYPGCTAGADLTYSKFGEENWEYGGIAHTIDIDGDDDTKGWTASPGDRFALVWPVDIALEGDNLVATLEASLDQSRLSDLVKSGLIVNVSLEVITAGDGFYAPSGNPLSTSPLPLGVFQAQNETSGQLETGPDIAVITQTVLPTATDAQTSNICVALYAEFDEYAQDRAGATEVLFDLPADIITLDLKQTRTGTGTLWDW